MNKKQLEDILNYLDQEFAGIVAKMSNEDKRKRAQHWAKEIGSLNYDDVMQAVHKLSEGNFMPRTAEIIREVREYRNINRRIENNPTLQKCFIWPDANGNEVYKLTQSDGTEIMYGTFKDIPEWMQIKFRWMADKTNPEKCLAWENYIMQTEKKIPYGNPGINYEVDRIMDSVCHG